MGKRITGKRAVLIGKGCELDRQIKELTEQLKQVKKNLEVLGKGTFTNGSGDSVTISVTDKYADIIPEKAYDLLKSKRLGKKLLDCVKVKVTEIKKVASVNGFSDELAKLRKVIGKTNKFTFK